MIAADEVTLHMDAGEVRDADSSPAAHGWPEKITRIGKCN
jgi:hypothetical protein